MLIELSSLHSPDNSKEGSMKRWVKIFENIFVSVAFAEMGEPHTSREILDMNAVYSPDVWGEGCVSVPVADGG